MIKTAPQFVLEVDDSRYRLAGGKLEPLAATDRVEGDHWVVSDFDGAVPQVMTVDSPIQYVDAVIEKRLRESGSLIGASRVLVCRKHRRGSRATEALFASVPAARCAQYSAAAEDDENHQLVFPLYALLARELDALRSKRPVAIALAHARHVDVVVGDARRTYGAFRASRHRAGDDSARLVENLANGLRRIEQENNIKIAGLRCHRWLQEEDERAEWAARLAAELGVECIEAEESRLQNGAGHYRSTAPGLLARLSIDDSVSTPTEKHLYRAKAALPLLAGLLAAVAILASLATVYWAHETRKLTVASATAADSLRPPEPGPAVLAAAYEQPLALAHTLGRAQIVPPLESVLAQVSAAVSERITFDEVIVEYPTDRERVALTLIGQSEVVGEGDGVPAFNTFLAALRQQGYELVDSELKTDISAFSFRVQLERGLS